MLYAEFNRSTLNDIIYTIDMIRLRCDITSFEFSKIETRLKTVYPDQVKNYYVSTGISDFKYNYNIEVNEGESYWFGFIHNSELTNKVGSLQNENTRFNFTLEFNPNKIRLRGLISYLLRMLCVHNCSIKSADFAMDIPVNILDIGRL